MQPLFERVRREGWRLLPEKDGFRLLEELGVSTPITLEFRDPEELSDELLDQLPGDLVVLKASCADLAHKTETGGVQVLRRNRKEIESAARRMAEQLRGREQRGFLLQEYIDVEVALGEELLLSLCWDPEFGPVLTLGSGGIHAETLGSHLMPESAFAIAAVDLLDRETFAASTTRLLAAVLLAQGQRGRPARISLERLSESVMSWARRALPLMEREVEEIEINPLVVRRGEPVALDVLVRLAPRRLSPAIDRPAEKIKCLLEPGSIGVVGVSKKLNPGHIILKNILRQGFDADRLWVIKPGVEEMEGCRCVESVGDLPERVDLLIVAVAAEQIPGLLETVIDRQLAESVIVIPGGLEEKAGNEKSANRLLRTLQRARVDEARGPVINGGNCMGIRSAPGKYDTFFLPGHKLPSTMGEHPGAALIAQSGAFLAARSSRLAKLPFRYSISIGNQLDLTLGDYLEYLAGESDIEVVAAYVEGFKALDGLKFLQAARAIRQAGRTVVLYRAGRTPAGIEAVGSHTASVAGSYLRTVALAKSAGVLVADTLADFEDLVGMAVRFADRLPLSRGLGGASNAGFECVVLSDQLRWFSPARFSPDTTDRLQSLLEIAGVDRLVDVRNPLDLTPMTGDELFARAAEEILGDPNVDVGVIGCVPLTGALNTLPVSAGHNEDLACSDSIASRLSDLWQRTDKPWVVIVDAGRPYDALADRLEQAGIPVFRHMDRAVRILETLAEYRESGPVVAANRGRQG